MNANKRLSPAEELQPQLTLVHREAVRQDEKTRKAERNVINRRFEAFLQFIEEVREQQRQGEVPA